MKKNIVKVALLCLMCLAGCSMGLRFEQMGRHYKTYVADSIIVRQATKVGVIACSNGGEINGSDISMDVGDVLDVTGNVALGLLQGGIVFSTRSGYKGIYYKYYPDQITPSLEMQTDSITYTISSTIALMARDSLNARGYEASLLENIPRHGSISIQQVTENAKKQGYDAVFIVYYTLLNSWNIHAGTSEVSVGGSWSNGQYRPPSTVRIEIVRPINRYAMVPNAALIDTKKNTVLWSNSYYGLVQNASIPNISQESFNNSVSEPVLKYGDDKASIAIANAMEIVFNPPLWRKSFTPLPSKK